MGGDANVRMLAVIKGELSQQTKSESARSAAEDKRLRRRSALITSVVNCELIPISYTARIRSLCAAIEIQEYMEMMKVNEFAAVFVAAIALLGQVHGRIYQTNDAIVFEIDRASDGSFLAKSFPFSQSDFMPIKNFLNRGLVPNSHIPFVEPIAEVNSYSIGLHPQQQGPIFYSWLHHAFVWASQILNQETQQNSVPCGAGPDQNRIVSGTEATPNSWPFIVGFMIPGSGSVDCGGSLISETKILTAAHCFEYLSMLELSQYVVKLGMHDRGDGGEQGDDAIMTRRIRRMALHKAFHAKQFYFDIAIITMDSPVTYSEAIWPVCLAPASSEINLYTGKTASVMGWGRTIPNVFLGSQKLMQTNVPIITNDECRQSMPSVANIVNHMLCVRTTDSSPCQGDSGGPLVVQSEPGGAWTQVGIVSFGPIGCKRPDFPASVFTRVNQLRKWINGNMRD